MKWTVLIIGICSLCLLIILNILWWYQIKVGCKDYLKLAADAPTVERAQQFLTKGMHYIEANGLTSGNSGIILHPPRSEVGIWYQQLKGALNTANLVVGRKESSSLTQLERDNALMKIREVVLDQGERGMVVTSPPHLSWYPHQVAICLWWVFTLLVCVAGAAIAILTD